LISEIEGKKKNIRAREEEKGRDRERERTKKKKRPRLEKKIYFKISPNPPVADIPRRWGGRY